MEAKRQEFLLNDLISQERILKIKLIYYLFCINRIKILISFCFGYYIDQIFKMNWKSMLFCLIGYGFSSRFVWFLLNASKSSSLSHLFPYKNSLPSYSAIFLKLQAILVVGKPVALEVSLCLTLADFSVPWRGIGLWCGNNWLLFHDVHRLFIQIKSRD